MANYVVCLKHGDKYSAEYVNILHNMVSRNLTIPFNFAVFTENAAGIKSGIEIHPLPPIPEVKGWWYKPREVLEIAKIGVYLLTNIILTSLPLWLTEPFMSWLNPSLKKRQRVAGYDPSTYKEIDWDRMETRNKAVLLKKARDEICLLYTSPSPRD